MRVKLEPQPQEVPIQVTLNCGSLCSCFLFAVSQVIDAQVIDVDEYDEYPLTQLSERGIDTWAFHDDLSYGRENWREGTLKINELNVPLLCLA